MTTGLLQQLVYLQDRRPGTRALIVGAEHVSFSAIQTLAHGGARAVGMATELPRHQSLELFRAGAALRYRVPLWTRTAVTAIHGRARVEGVELTELDSGRVRRLACDTVVFSADWVPDHELAVAAGVALDPGHARPRRGLGAAHHAAGRVRLREPAPRRRDGGRRRARRPPRRGRGWPASWPATAPGPMRPCPSCARTPCSGSCRTW